MSKILLDFDLAAGLFLDLGLDDFGFVETFESEDVFWFAFGADHVYTSKFAFPKGAADVKTGEVPFTGWTCPVNV